MSAAPFTIAAAPNFNALNMSPAETWSSCSAARCESRLTMASRYNFFSARCTMRSSTVPAVTSLYTCTGLVWPMRWTRAMACKSAWGFQSESKRMHVSAVWRLTPKPPALVDMRKRKTELLGALNDWMSTVRWTLLVPPSSRENS